MSINSIQTSNIGGNQVIPQPTTNREKQQTAFKSGKEQADSFTKEKKDSFLHRNRGIFGFFAGAIAGERISTLAIIKKMKTPPNLGKEMAIAIPIELALGLLGQVVATKIGENKN